MASEPLRSTDQQRLRDCAERVLSDPAAAAVQLRRILEDDPLDAAAYRLLATAKTVLAKAGSGAGEVRAVGVSAGQTRLMQAAQALEADDLPTAEVILRRWLLDKPADVTALRLMADLAARLGRQTEATKLLRLVLELAPAFAAAKLALAAVLHRQGEADEAITMLDDVLAAEPDNLAALNIKAAALAQVGRADEASAAYQDSLQLSPRQARVWMNYGQLLRTLGRQEQSVEALRRSVEIAPWNGELWWSLSDLKTVKLDAADIARMQAALSLEDSTDDDRAHLHFAIGKAFEDVGDAGRAMEHYLEGNRLRRTKIDYDPDMLTTYVRAARRIFTADFFEQRRGQGCAAPDPIFIVGMPRSGSTLVEQILASHRQIEGTMELPELLDLAERIGRDLHGHVDALNQLSPVQLTALGEKYIERTRRYRRSGEPFFIDKMPNNWVYLPLIQLILPNARIIDARRHPMDGCFSIFKQQFLSGQPWSNDLYELGCYYADYVALMEHVDAVLPQRVHRLFHENLVADTESEVRRVLDYLGLPYDAACLRFFENDRPVKTASADQVRRPINREGIDRWRAFEQWLDPLKAGLGSVLDEYPQSPVGQSNA